MPELILFETNNKVSYFKKCTLIFNVEEKIFDIKSDVDGLEINITNFSHNFCRKNNIFCVIKNDDSGFALIFSNQKFCDEIFDSFKKLKQSNGNGIVIYKFNETFRQLLTRIFYEIENNKQALPRLIQIANDIIDLLSDKEKLQFHDILPDQKVKAIKVEIVDLTKEDDIPQLKVNASKIETLELSDHEVNNVNQVSQLPSLLKRKFPDKAGSIEHTSNKSPKKQQKTVSITRESPIQGLIEVNDFELETPSVPIINEATPFDPVNSVFTTVKQNSDQSKSLPKRNNISVFLSSDMYIPEPQLQKSFLKVPSPKIKKTFKRKASKKFVKLTNFKLEHYIHDDGSKQEMLTIYDSTNKELCYTYLYVKHRDSFHCKNCKFLNKTVSIKIHKKNVNRIMVSYGTNKHFCQPQKEGTTFHQIKIKKNRDGKINDLIIFDNGNKYFFNCISCNIFRCLGCQGGGQRKNCQILLFQNEERCSNLWWRNDATSSSKFSPKFSIVKNFTTIICEP